MMRGFSASMPRASRGRRILSLLRSTACLASSDWISRAVQPENRKQNEDEFSGDCALLAASFETLSALGNRQVIAGNHADRRA